MYIDFSKEDLDSFTSQDEKDRYIAKLKEMASIAGKVLRKWQEFKKQIEQEKRAELPDNFFSDEDSTG